jgi:hypothetical protein
VEKGAFSPPNVFVIPYITGENRKMIESIGSIDIKADSENQHLHAEFFL